MSFTSNLSRIFLCGSQMVSACFLFFPPSSSIFSSSSSPAPVPHPHDLLFPCPLCPALIPYFLRPPPPRPAPSPPVLLDSHSGLTSCILALFAPSPYPLPPPSHLDPYRLRLRPQCCGPLCSGLIFDPAPGPGSPLLWPQQFYVFIFDPVTYISSGLSFPKHGKLL